jgi:hypothetical protein
MPPGSDVKDLGKVVEAVNDGRTWDIPPGTVPTPGAVQAITDRLKKADVAAIITQVKP